MRAPCWSISAEGRIEPTHVSGDGFHPSTEGHRRVASAFAEALATSAFAADLSLPTGSASP